MHKVYFNTFISGPNCPITLLSHYFIEPVVNKLSKINTESITLKHTHKELKTGKLHFQYYVFNNTQLVFVNDYVKFGYTFMRKPTSGN